MDCRRVRVFPFVPQTGRPWKVRPCGDSTSRRLVGIIPTPGPPLVPRLCLGTRAARLRRARSGGGASGHAFPGRAWERGGAMLREEQIDIRRQRAVEGKFTIKNLGRNRVFSDYQVVNPATGGQYTVAIRGFEVGDNTC